MFSISYQNAFENSLKQIFLIHMGWLKSFINESKINFKTQCVIKYLLEIKISVTLTNRICE